MTSQSDYLDRRAFIGAAAAGSLSAAETENLPRPTETRKGVSPGETVVTDGQMMLFPGAHVMAVAEPKGDATTQPTGAQ